MTFEVITIVACDAPGCTTRGPWPEASYRWTEVYAEGQIPAELRWGVHLCADHPDVFAGHRPAAEVKPPPVWVTNRQPLLVVSCGCGAALGPITPVKATGDIGDGPAYLPERLWWNHLPDELKEYGLRGKER